jgi:hypothetical protein
MSTLKVIMKKTLDTKYYVTPPDVQAYINRTYIDTGLVTEVVEFTDDESEHSITFTFKDDAAKTQYRNDPIILKNAADRKAYNALHEIASMGRESN